MAVSGPALACRHPDWGRGTLRAGSPRRQRSHQLASGARKLCQDKAASQLAGTYTPVCWARGLQNTRQSHADKTRGRAWSLRSGRELALPSRSPCTQCHGSPAQHREAPGGALSAGPDLPRPVSPFISAAWPGWTVGRQSSGSLGSVVVMAGSQLPFLEVDVGPGTPLLNDMTSG